MLVEPLEEKEVKKGGIIIPDTAKEKPQEGESRRPRHRQGRRRWQEDRVHREEGRQVLISQIRRHRNQSRRRGLPDHARGRHPRHHWLIRVATSNNSTNNYQLNLWQLNNSNSTKPPVRRSSAASRNSRGRQGDPRTKRPQRHPRQEIRLPDHHQGRCHRRQGNRTRRSL